MGNSESDEVGQDHILGISLGVFFAVLAFIVVVAIIGVTVKLVQPSFRKWKEGELFKCDTMYTMSPFQHLSYGECCFFVWYKFTIPCLKQLPLFMANTCLDSGQTVPAAICMC